MSSFGFATKGLAKERDFSCRISTETVQYLEILLIQLKQKNRNKFPRSAWFLTFEVRPPAFILYPGMQGTVSQRELQLPRGYREIELESSFAYLQRLSAVTTGGVQLDYGDCLRYPGAAAPVAWKA